MSDTRVPARVHRVVSTHATYQKSWKLSRPLQTPEKAFIVSVRSNPEPDYHILFDHTNCSVVTRDASGIDGSSIVHLLESQAWMVRVVAKEGVGLARTLLNFGW